jgi:hypothetical protein
MKLSIINQGFLYIDKLLENITRPIYYSLLAILYCLYFFVIIGVFYINTEYIRVLIVAIQVFISCILIIRFNPIRHHTFNESDSDIIFASAAFLLINTLLTEGVIKYMKSSLGVQQSFNVYQ